MADFANSTPVPERPLLREVDAPGLLLSSPELPARLGGSAARAIPRIPNRMTYAEVFVSLMELKKRTEKRLLVLLERLEPDHGGEPLIEAEQPKTAAQLAVVAEIRRRVALLIRDLPSSGLHQVAPNVLLFKDWRHV